MQLESPYWELCLVLAVTFPWIIVVYLNTLLAQAKNDVKDRKLKAWVKRSASLVIMSHELRTPIFGLMGWVEILENALLTGTNQEKLEYCANIKSCANDLFTTTTAVEDFAKLSSTNHTSHRQSTFDIETTIFSLPKPFPSLSASSVGLNFEFNLDPACTTFFGDQNKIQRAFLNLLENSIKFTHTGAILIRAHSRLVPPNGHNPFPTQPQSILTVIQELEQTRFPEHLFPDINDKVQAIRKTQRYYTLNPLPPTRQIVFLFEILDTGIGFTLPHGKISPFNQSHSCPEKRDYGGTGLGLFITDQLVQSMNGSLSIASVPGVGSLFSIALTCPFDSLSTLAPTPQQSPSPERHDTTSKLPILVAEDNSTCQALLKAFLAKLDYSYVMTADGPGALAVLESGAPFSLILMDFHMPKVTGLEVLESVRSSGSQIPVILMTSDGRPEVKEGLEKFQNSSFLLKPFRFEELRTKINQAIGTRRYRRRSCPGWPSSPVETRRWTEGDLLN